MLDVTTNPLPLPPGPRVGDHVVVQCDVLAEIGREAPGLPPTWSFVPEGTRGRLIGWRDRPDDRRAIVDVSGVQFRIVVFVGDSHLRSLPAPASPDVGRRRAVVDKPLHRSRRRRPV